MNRGANKDSWKVLTPKGVSLPDDIGKDDEVWIFEAASDFDVSTLEGKKIHLTEGQMIEQSDGIFCKQLMVDDYGSLSFKPEHVVLPQEKDGDKWKYVCPVGRISIVDCLDNVETDVVPSAVIARCPKLPTGLKRRYRPFGIEKRSSRKAARLSKQSHEPAFVPAMPTRSPNKHKAQSTPRSSKR